MTTRVGSYNLYQRSNDAAADAAVRSFTQLVDVAGLQEYGGPVRRKSLERLSTLGFDFFKPHHPGSAPPIIWSAKRFSLVSGSTPLVAKGRRVNPAPGRRSTLPDLYASIAVLTDLRDGSETVIGNLHTPSHVQLWPGPRRKMYREAVDALAADLQLDTGRPCYLIGDWNWQLTKPSAEPRRLLAPHGLLSQWDGITPNAGTHGRRVIDGTFARSKAAKATVLTTYHVGDHRPTVATY